MTNKELNNCLGSNYIKIKIKINNKTNKNRIRNNDKMLKINV